MEKKRLIDEVDEEVEAEIYKRSRIIQKVLIGRDNPQFGKTKHKDEMSLTNEEDSDSQRSSSGSERASGSNVVLNVDVRIKEGSATRSEDSAQGSDVTIKPEEKSKFKKWDATALSEVSDGEEEEDEYGSEGYAFITPRQELNQGRYKVIRKLGWGHFSTVWLCKDKADLKYVAVKAVKRKLVYNRMAEMEIEVLKRIEDADINDSSRNKILQIVDDFEYNAFNGKSKCLVMEPIGRDLYKLIKDANALERNIHPTNVRSMTRQILEALEYLHTKCKVIHSDLKPDNILVKYDASHLKFLEDEALHWDAIGQPYPSSATSSNPLQNEDNPFGLISEQPKPPIKCPTLPDCNYQIVLADLGNAYELGSKLPQPTYIQTLPYRCFEVIMGSGYNVSADIWSLGCIVFELTTGEPLFDLNYSLRSQLDPTSGQKPTKHDDLLAHFEALLGNIPIYLENKGIFAKKFYNEQGTLKNVRPYEPKNLVQCLKEFYEWEDQRAVEFSNFILPMLDYDKAKRASASELLKSPWLQ